METTITAFSSFLNPVTLIQLFGSLLLFERYRYSISRSKKDMGLFWLAASFLIVVPYFALYADVDTNSDASAFRSAVGTICSFLNNICLLMAYQFFAERRKTIRPFLFKKKITINYEHYNFGVMLVMGFTIVLTLTIILVAYLSGWSFSENGWYDLHEWPNTVLSIASLLLLVGVVIRSFRENNRPGLSVLALVVFTLLILTQFYYIAEKFWADYLDNYSKLLGPLFTSVKLTYLCILLQIPAVVSDRDLEQAERGLRGFFRFLPKNAVPNLYGPAHYPILLNIPRSNEPDSPSVNINILLTFREYFAFVFMLKARYFEDQGEGNTRYVHISSQLNANDLSQLKSRLKRALHKNIDDQADDTEDLIEEVILEHSAGNVRFRLPIMFEVKDIKTTVDTFRSHLNSNGADFAYVNPLVLQLQAIIDLYTTNTPVQVTTPELIPPPQLNAPKPIIIPNKTIDGTLN